MIVMATVNPYLAGKGEEKRLWGETCFTDDTITNLNVLMTNIVTLLKKYEEIKRKTAKIKAKPLSLV